MRRSPTRTTGSPVRWARSHYVRLWGGTLYTGQTAGRAAGEGRSEGTTLSLAHLATCPGLLLTTGQRVDQLRGATWVGNGVTRATKMIPHGNHLGRALALHAFQKPLGGRSLERRDQPPRDTHTHATHAKDTEDDGRPQRAHRFIPCLRPVLCTYLRGKKYKRKR